MHAFVVTIILRKTFPAQFAHNYVYHLLLVTLESLPFCVVENWGLKK